MKSENARLLLGLGIGALVGAAVGYLSTRDNRRRACKTLHDMGHTIHDGVHAAYTHARAAAEHVGADMAHRAGAWAERTAEHTAAAADHVAQKADELHRDLNHRAAADDRKQAQQTAEFKRDVRDLKERTEKVTN